MLLKDHEDHQKYKSVSSNLEIKALLRLLAVSASAAESELIGVGCRNNLNRGKWSRATIEHKLTSLSSSSVPKYLSIISKAF